MKNNIKIAIDVDGVLANFILAICRKFKQPFISVQQFYQSWLDFSKVVDNFDFWKKLPVLNPPEALTFDIHCYMTSLPKGMKVARKKWLKNNGFPVKDVVISHHKHKTCKKLGIDLLIDDKPETIIKCKENAVFAVQYVPYYSNMPVVTKANIKHLPEADRYIKAIELFKSVEDVVPLVIKHKIIKEFHNSEFSHFHMFLQFIVNLYSGEEISRWNALTVSKYYGNIMTKSILGEEIYDRFDSAVEMAKESL